MHNFCRWGQLCIQSTANLSLTLLITSLIITIPSHKESNWLSINDNNNLFLQFIIFSMQQPISVVIEIFDEGLEIVNDNHIATLQTMTPQLTPFGGFLSSPTIDMDGLTFTLQYQLRCGVCIWLQFIIVKKMVIRTFFYTPLRSSQTICCHY